MKPSTIVALAILFVVVALIVVAIVWRDVWLRLIVALFLGGHPP